MYISNHDLDRGHLPEALWIIEKNADIGGGRISFEDIDRLAEYPRAEAVAISGLRQDTFEYFIRKYGAQFKAISFHKNKLVEDWSLLGTLPNLEYVLWFVNHRIRTLWDMKENKALKGLHISDFSRLTSLDGIEAATSLRQFWIGNAIWLTMEIESLMPLAGLPLTYLGFFCKRVRDGDLSFFPALDKLQCFDCALNAFSTEQFAWIAANCPGATGRALQAKEDFDYTWADEPGPGTSIVGKRKPTLLYKGNEERIQRYVDAFERLKAGYQGVPYRQAFPSKP